VLAKEYGRKPYLAKNYREMMDATTNADVWGRILEKHSEFEKPYHFKPGEYQQMQYLHPSMPGFPFDVQDFDFPFNPYDSSTFPWDVVFACHTYPCYCAGQTKCTDVQCTYPITAAVLRSGCEGITIKVVGTQLCVTADADASGTCRVDIFMKVPKNKQGLPEGYEGVVGPALIDRCGDCITCNCDGISIGYTSAQMAVDEVQTLSATGAVVGCNYDWAITSGGGELSAATGATVNYTAPADNAECANNSTITLSVGGSLCDTLSIAINAVASADHAYYILNECIVECKLNDGSVENCLKINCTGTSTKYCYGCVTNTYTCDGVFHLAALHHGSNNVSDAENCAVLMAIYCSDPATTVDLRTEQMITAGCCPAELL